MFRKRDANGQLFESSNLIPEEKRKRLDQTWAAVFRSKALSLIDESRFAPMFCEDNGRPNQPVQVVLGTLVLKELLDLTDREALEHLEFNLLWQHALRLTPEEAHLCQKTLHNFRARLMAHDGGRLAFEDTTTKILETLGTQTARQRLDSTHITSNIARLTRLGLFCETIRVFLRALQSHHPRLFRKVPETLRGRYLKDGKPTKYEDARSSDSKRRLAVCARDVYRLLEAMRETAASKLEEYVVLERLFEDQCEITKAKTKAGEDDDDAMEEAVPVALKEPKTIASDSLQSPHDVDVTYSGHKGKGYEVQVAETTDERNEVEIITHVDVTPSSGSDASQTVPVLASLAEREIKPTELVADTTYGSVENGLAAARMGTELVAPVAGSAPVDNVDKARPAPSQSLSPIDFKVDPCGELTLCPAGEVAIRQLPVNGNENRVELHFARSGCERCPFFQQCPARLSRDEETYSITVNLTKTTLEQRRTEQATPQFKERYACRAGIEATNSELKRSHGLGRLRVRGRIRVRLVIYLKAIACNFKRMIRALLLRARSAGAVIPAMAVR
ncbi:transposase [bacterium]|nr:transposase [bacterium]